jgi:hypothetical protein
LKRLLIDPLIMSQTKGLTNGLSKIWMTNKISSTLIIPIDTARKYELNEPSQVTVEKRPDLNDILIKKLEI